MAETIVLFDGRGLDGWRMCGPGGFEVVDGVLETRGGMGLLWYAARELTDFVLDLDWAVTKPEDNSGVFLRFPDPGDDPWVAVDHGYEVQILDAADVPERSTGAIYRIAAPSRPASRPPGEWNHFRISVTGQRYRVELNGVEVVDFTGDRRTRGYVGLQNHDDDSLVRFRDVRVTV
jgi:hypothetical protein